MDDGPATKYNPDKCCPRELYSVFHVRFNFIPRSTLRAGFSDVPFTTVIYHDRQVYCVSLPRRMDEHHISWTNSNNCFRSQNRLETWPHHFEKIILYLTYRLVRSSL